MLCYKTKSVASLLVIRVLIVVCTVVISVLPLFLLFPVLLHLFALAQDRPNRGCNQYRIQSVNNPSNCLFACAENEAHP